MFRVECFFETVRFVIFKLDLNAVSCMPRAVCGGGNRKVAGGVALRHLVAFIS